MKEKIHFDTPDAKDFVATFRQLTNRHESWKVWSDFVTLSACSIAVQFDCADRDRVEQRLKWVSNVSDRYSDDELERFCKLLEITASALQADPNQDFLGRLYMSLDFGNSWRGQFFTPWDVAYMMAMMTMGQDDDLIAKKGYASTLDTCCGAGCMLLAAAAAYNATHKDRSCRQDMLFVGQDLDQVVALMCYIQLSILGYAGYVAIGNSLTNPLGGTELFPTIGEGGELWYTPKWYSPIWQLRRLKELAKMIDSSEGQAKPLET